MIPHLKFHFSTPVDDTRVKDVHKSPYPYSCHLVITEYWDAKPQTSTNLDFSSISLQKRFNYDFDFIRGRKILHEPFEPSRV